jgi:hypothetical protein
MRFLPFAFPGLAQVPCAICGHPHSFHHNLDGPCNALCGCKRWTEPVGFGLLYDDPVISPREAGL